MANLGCEWQLSAATMEEMFNSKGTLSVSVVVIL